jgi:tetratricopeptide (TPR) repeat protein
MVYALLQTGQDRAAGKLVATAADVFSHFDPANATGAAPPTAAYFAHAAIPARYSLERHAWSEAAKLEPLPSHFPFTDSITFFARGLGAAHVNDAAGVRAALASLDTIHAKLTAMGENYWATQTAIQRYEVSAILAYAEGHAPEAIKGLTAAAELEDHTELASITPGPLVPAREMLGEMLLAMKKPAEALKEFEASLKQEPNRYWSVYGAAEAAKLGGDADASRMYARQLSDLMRLADQPGRGLTSR